MDQSAVSPAIVREKNKVIVIIGVSGSGKTTVGRLLSEELDWKYYEGDDFHPQANVEKLKNGIPLSDADRRPWLEILRDLIRNCLERGDSAVVACSALKESYRRFLLVDERVVLIYLKGDYELIQQRLSKRHGHFMKANLLASQFATLEEPEAALQVDVSLSPREIVESIRSRLRL
ncbi:MAG TPA: gluconokinase [Candidatus Binatia bacterium]|nr:gluconokinase [Candidatus Binatia bacterium]